MVLKIELTVIKTEILEMQPFKKLVHSVWGYFNKIMFENKFESGWVLVYQVFLGTVVLGCGRFTGTAVIESISVS